MSNTDGTPTRLEELALWLYGQLKDENRMKNELELIEEALKAAQAMTWTTD